MRMPKFNIHAPHDWRGDLRICIKAMRHAVIFIVAVVVVTMALLPIYQIASKNSRPYDVYCIEDLRVAMKDPFVDRIVLHEDLELPELPKRKITFIKAYKDIPDAF